MRFSAAIGIPHGSVVGGPYSSWLTKLPSRPMAWPSSMAEANTSSQRAVFCPIQRV